MRCVEPLVANVKFVGPPVTIIPSWLELLLLFPATASSPVTYVHSTKYCVVPPLGSSSVNNASQRRAVDPETGGFAPGYGNEPTCGLSCQRGARPDCVPAWLARYGSEQPTPQS